MPYTWTDERPDAAELHLWPHNSLTAEGFAGVLLAFFGFATIPLYSVLGTWVFWAVLPFVLIVTGAIYYALRRNARDRRILEVLTMDSTHTRLVRHNPRGQPQDWEANTHWVRIACHEDGGPVPYYVTLTGAGREVEIGAFLSEDERRALYGELQDRVARLGRG